MISVANDCSIDRAHHYLMAIEPIKIIEKKLFYE